MANHQSNEQNELDQALLIFQQEFAVFGNRFIKDSSVRRRYEQLIASTSRELRETAIRTGNFREGARLANALRNEVMDAIRNASSDVARAFAGHLKPQGLKLDFVLDRAAQKLFGRTFGQIKDASSLQKVFLEVIESAGRSNPAVQKWALRLGKLGRGFWVATLGIAVYEVATAEDRWRETRKQSTAIALGSTFSVAGGWAGVACGPAAVACVPLGVFLGGALGAVAADLIY